MRRYLLLLPLLLALVLAAAPPAAGSPARDRGWGGLDVPYLSGGKVHFRGNAVREPLRDPDFPTSIITFPATRSAAVLQAGAEGTLLELPARRGPLRLLTRAAVGIPRTDPSGHWVFWTASRRQPGVRLMAYDTRRNQVRPGPLLGDDARVWAVDGATAYVGGGRLQRWTPGSRPQPLPRGATVDGLLADVDGGRYAVSVFGDDVDRAEVRAEDGTVLATVPGSFAFGFDPSGRYLATYGSVWDSATGSSATLRLGRWTPFALRWAPTGDLVLAAEDSRHDRYERTRARRFACDPATGACERLPDPRGVDRYTVEHEPFESSSLAQLALLIGS